MSELPLVSILTYCRNAEATIGECIQSALDLKYPHVEVVVQDGASTDGTLDVLHEFGDAIRLESRPDAGVAGGFNGAVVRARGEIIGTCEADDRLMPEAAHWAVGALAANPRAAAVYGDVLNFDADGGERLFCPPEWNYQAVLCAELVPPFGAAFFRRSMADDYGLHGDTTLSSNPDFELWTRFGRRHHAVYWPGTVCARREHAGSSTCQAQHYDRYVRDRLRILDRVVGEAPSGRLATLRRQAHAGAHLWAAESLNHLGEMEEAFGYLERAIALEPREERLGLVMCTMARKCAVQDEPRVWLDRLLATGIDFPEREQYEPEEAA